MTSLFHRANDVSTVYGPVHSWRLGRSLGIDLLAINSICSFRCAYCQLGRINVHTRERKVYVATEKVLNQLRESDWATADTVTFSGSGEPTLAANLGEVVRSVKRITAKPAVVLTNATTLNDAGVRRDLRNADQVSCKLDAADEDTFRKINRPVAGVTLCSVVEGILRLREEYTGYLTVQIMLLPSIGVRTQGFVDILRELQPDQVQLNLPSRPRPLEWVPEARGNLSTCAIEQHSLKSIGEDEARRFEADLRRLTRLRIVSRLGRGATRETG